MSANTPRACSAITVGDHGNHSAGVDGVLHRQHGRNRRAMAAQAEQGFHIGLNSGAAAWVQAGKTEDNGFAGIHADYNTGLTTIRMTMATRRKTGNSLKMRKKTWLRTLPPSRKAPM